MEKNKNIEKTFHDFCGVKVNREITLQLDKSKKEEVIFSCNVNKYNKFGMKQSRILLLTNLKLYNIKGEQIQRRIAVDCIMGIIKSMKGNSNEFLVMIKHEYDYRFESDQREEIFESIKYVFWKAHGFNLPVYGIPEKLKDHSTSKEDAAKNLQKIIDDKWRLK